MTGEGRGSQPFAHENLAILDAQLVAIALKNAKSPLVQYLNEKRQALRSLVGFGFRVR